MISAVSGSDSRAAFRVERIREGFGSGRTRTLGWRRRQLRALERLIHENNKHLIRALHADLGKPAAEAWISELSTVLSELANAGRNLERWAAAERVPSPLAAWPSRSAIVREPYGVVLIISPWNYPLQLTLAPLIGAIAAGNCAVIKPSEISATTSAVLAGLLPRYLDPGCFAVFEGGADVAQELLAQRFDSIFFTGSTAVGRVVMKAAAEHLTPVTLELGGKSPCIVADDADLRVAARQVAFGKFLNAGQTCIAPDYVLVSRDRKDALIDELRKAIRSFYGSDPKRSPDYGRIIDLRHFDRLEALLRDGTIAAGGERDRDNRYIAPTVLTDVPRDAPVLEEEIFGPILPVLEVGGIDEAIACVNARPKPLALYLFTQDRALADRVVNATSSGGVSVNGTLLHYLNPRLPFGGVGPSGIGAYHGRFGFETFSHRRAVLQKNSRVDLGLGYPPFTRTKLAILKRLI